MRTTYPLPRLGAACALLSLLCVTTPSLAEGEVIQLSFGVERIGGVSVVNVSPKDSDDDLKLTVASLGGPVYNPAGAPRIGIDYVLPSGITLGGALGATAGALSDDKGDVGAARFVLLEPRIGYRVPVSPTFDVIPRGGVSVLWGSFQDSDGTRCDYDYQTGYEDCYDVDGDKFSGTATVLSLEVVGALRVTNSLNFLGGLAYDSLVSASGEVKEDKGNDTETESDDYEGSASSIQLWLGIGGYL